MAKSHVLSKPVLGQRTSPYLQSKLVLLGCEQVFGQVPALVESLLGIQINQSQVYRTCQMAAFVADEAVVDEPSVVLKGQLNNSEKTLYGMVDGSMLLTEEGWQETKVGRVFEAHLADSSTEAWPQWTLGPSEYVAHRGHYEEFTRKFEQLFPPASPCKQVLVTDGATWIGNWLKETYPKATHILDYYHLKQKLAIAAQAVAHPQEWLAEQENYLFEGKQQAVEGAVAALENLPEAVRAQLLSYLKNNRYRTRYDLYRKEGLMISSGPVEAAHRTLLQVRMKRSGQRWSESGCDKMILLRAAYQSGKFDLITDLFRQDDAFRQMAA